MMQMKARGLGTCLLAALIAIDDPIAISAANKHVPSPLAFICIMIQCPCEAIGGNVEMLGHHTARVQLETNEARIACKWCRRRHPCYYNLVPQQGTLLPCASNPRAPSRGKFS